MKHQRYHAEIETTDESYVTGPAHQHLMIGGPASVSIVFPDRTPYKRMQAIADAINAALAAARELEGAGRD